MLVGASVLAFSTTSVSAAVCLDGSSDKWVNVGACNSEGYCARICVSQAAFDEGSISGAIVDFLSAISSPRVPSGTLEKDALSWTRPGAHGDYQGLKIYIQFCQSPIAGATTGVLCPKGKIFGE